MSQFSYVHPDNPQQRLINQAVETMRKGGVTVYPTNSGYVLGCKTEDKNAMECICCIRQLPDGHNFTLMCCDPSELSIYSFIDNVAFRLMKNNTPGNYTFILKGTEEVPRRLLQGKHKIIGMRVSPNSIAQTLLEALGESMLFTSPTLPGSEFTESDSEETKDRLEKQVGLIIRGGYLGQKPTTVIDLTDDTPAVVREGVGDMKPFLQQIAFHGRKMMAGIYRCILLSIVGLFFSSLSYAKNVEIPSYEEGISLFDIEVTLQLSGVPDIKENTCFQVRNQQIGHGFCRDLPRLWIWSDGDATLLNYHIVGVTCDGIPGPWHLDWHIGLMNVVVGDKQCFLSQGDYHHQIHHQVKNAFLRKGDSDLLIWNVTGNHWPPKIYKTLPSLKLPDIVGNPPSEIVFFAGEEGDTYRSDHILEDGRIEFHDPFYREDFTVLYRWPHALLGNAPAPQTTNIFSHLLLPSTSSLLICFSSLFLACGWLYLWKCRPQFTPIDATETDVIPPDYTPGMLRLDTKLVYGGKGFCADIVNLVMEGRTHLEDHYDKNQQILIRVNEGATRNNAVLLPAEQLLLEVLSRKGDKVALAGRRSRVLCRVFLRM